MPTSNCRHTQPTRDQVLVAHAAEMIARTSLSQEGFADALSACVFMLVPEKATEKGYPNLKVLAREADTAAYLRAANAWMKRVERWLTGDVELPSWVEEAWVQALAPDYRERCVNELAARYGLVGARALQSDACAATAFGQLIARLGLAVEAGSEVLADGKIDAADAPHLPEFIDRLLAVESRAFELRRVAENELSIHRGGKPLHLVG